MSVDLDAGLTVSAVPVLEALVDATVVGPLSAVVCVPR
jgi:hypothetical protein